jgi:hypothetical protein
MLDRDEATCSGGLTEQCGNPNPWNGGTMQKLFVVLFCFVCLFLYSSVLVTYWIGTFFGGIVHGLILTLLFLGGFYAYKTY